MKAKLAQALSEKTTEKT